VYGVDICLYKADDILLRNGHGNAPGFDFRYVEKIVHQLEEPHRVSFHCPQEITVHRRAGVTLERRFNRGKDEREGRPDLVRDIGEKVRFYPVHLFELFVGDTELFRPFLDLCLQALVQLDVFLYLFLCLEERPSVDLEYLVCYDAHGDGNNADVNKVVGYDELRQPETPCCVKRECVGNGKVGRAVNENHGFVPGNDDRGQDQETGNVHDRVEHDDGVPVRVEEQGAPYGEKAGAQGGVGRGVEVARPQEKDRNNHG